VKSISEHRGLLRVAQKIVLSFIDVASLGEVAQAKNMRCSSLISTAKPIRHFFGSVIDKASLYCAVL